MMKQYQFTIIQTDDHNQQIGKKCGIFYTGASRIGTAAARAFKQFERDHGITSKQQFFSVFVREVR